MGNDQSRNCHLLTFEKLSQYIENLVLRSKSTCNGHRSPPTTILCQTPANSPNGPPVVDEKTPLRVVPPPWALGDCVCPGADETSTNGRALPVCSRGYPEAPQKVSGFKNSKRRVAYPLPTANSPQSSCSNHNGYLGPLCCRPFATPQPQATLISSGGQGERVSMEMARISTIRDRRYIETAARVCLNRVCTKSDMRKVSKGLQIEKEAY